MKRHIKKTVKRTSEQEYQRIFSPLPTSQEGQFYGEESLEQPSALKYVPSTTKTTVEMAVGPQTPHDAKLAPDIY